jgi:hypothetical protein
MSGRNGENVAFATPCKEAFQIGAPPAIKVVMYVSDNDREINVLEKTSDKSTRFYQLNKLSS